MTNRVTVIEQMHQLAQAAVEKVTLDLTGEASLSEQDFKLKFTQKLAEEILEKGNQYGKISDGVFGMADKLTELGWKEVTPVHPVEQFINFVDYANKVYVNRIPNAYYAGLFFTRLLENLSNNHLTEGVYKYTFANGETLHHSPEAGGGMYSHEYLVVERVAGMPEYEQAQEISE